MTAKPIATFGLAAIDTNDAEGLARFYGAILGWEIDPDRSQEGWVQLKSPEGATIAFQQVDDYKAPEWPGQEHPQQAHIDLDVEDLDEGEAAILALGARKSEHQPGKSFRVYFDPSDHPFCLVQW